MSRKTLSRITYVVFAVAVVVQLWIVASGQISFGTRTVTEGAADKAKLAVVRKPGWPVEYNACFGKPGE